MKWSPCLAKSLWERFTNSLARGCMGEVLWSRFFDGVWLVLYLFIYFLPVALAERHLARQPPVVYLSLCLFVVCVNKGKAYTFSPFFFISEPQLYSGFSHQHPEMGYLKDNKPWIPACCACLFLPHSPLTPLFAQYSFILSNITFGFL